jgi:hypothetical protein
VPGTEYTPDTQISHESCVIDAHNSCMCFFHCCGVVLQQCNIHHTCTTLHKQSIFMKYTHCFGCFLQHHVAVGLGVIALLLNLSCRVRFLCNNCTVLARQRVDCRCCGRRVRQWSGRRCINVVEKKILERKVVENVVEAGNKTSPGVTCLFGSWGTHCML